MSRRAGLLLALAVPAVVTALPAGAAEPSRTAWYTAVAAGPLAAPAPTTADGDLRVAGTGERPTAYGALLLPGEAGTLTLDVVPGSALGTVEVAACPTSSGSWQAGGNQPFDDGPGYDCDVAAAFGTLAAGGGSVEFLLDDAFARGGSLDVALVPLPEADVVFAVDLTAPRFTAATAPPAEQPPAGPGAPPAGVPPLGDGASGTPVATPAEPAPLPALDLPAPALDVPALEAPPPDLAGAGSPAGTPADVPAPAAAPAAGAGVPPTLALAPAPQAVPAAASSTAQDGARRLLALLALVAVSAGAGYAAGQQRTAPRLLGGRARAVQPAPGVLAVPPAPPARAELPRGIGRFSRVRDAAPRRLR